MMCNYRVALMIESVHVTREVVLECPTDEAWELLTDPEELAAWLGRPVDFELEISDQRVGFVWSDEGGELSNVEFVLEEVDGGIRRLPIGANWDDRLLDLELLCLTRAAVRV